MENFGEIFNRLAGDDEDMARATTDQNALDSFSRDIAAQAEEMMMAAQEEWTTDYVMEWGGNYDTSPPPLEAATE